MIRSIPQLEATREEWDRLSAGQQSPLLDHDWFASCAEAFHRDDELSVVTSWKGKTLCGAAPLVREGDRLVLLGGSRLFEPCDWLYASDEAAADLVERALALGRPLVLQRVPSRSGVLRALSTVSPWRAVSLVRPTADSLAVDTRGTWDTYHESLSTRTTLNLRRLRRKSEKALGPIAIVESQPTSAEVDGHLETVVAVEGSGWKGRQGSSLGARADLRDFFRRYCRRAAAKGRLRVSTLSFGGRVAAVELPVEAYRRV